MENNKCLKPPTRLYSMRVTIQFVSSIICMYIYKHKTKKHNSILHGKSNINILTLYVRRLYR